MPTQEGTGGDLGAGAVGAAVLQSRRRDAGKRTLAGEGGEEHAARRLGSMPAAIYDGLRVAVRVSLCEAVWGPGCGGGERNGKVRGTDRLEKSTCSRRAALPADPGCLGESVAVSIATAAADAHCLY